MQLTKSDIATKGDSTQKAIGNTVRCGRLN